MNRARKERVLGVGLVGVGGAAVNMLPAFERSPYFKITAAADRDGEVLQRFAHDYPEAKTFGSVEELAECDAVDLVYIGTPSRLHHAHACAALTRGKHVLIEKPMAVTLEEAEEMIVVAERNGALLGVNVKHSFEPRIGELRRLARSGELGRLRLVNSWRYVNWLYQPRSKAEKTPGWGSGILWRQGPHQFDYLRTICGGLLRSVRGTCQVFDPARGVPGAYSAFLEFEDGTVCTATCSGYDHFNSRRLVPGSKEPRHGEARAVLAAHAAEANWEEAAAAGERYQIGDRPKANDASSSSGWLLGGPVIASFERGDVRFSATGLIVDGDTEQWEIPLQDRGDGRDGRLTTFYRAITLGQPLPADGRWGKATQEVLVALEDSAAKRTEVMLKHQTAVVDPLDHDERIGLQA